MDISSVLMGLGTYTAVNIAQKSLSSSFWKDLRKVFKGKALLYAVQIQPINEDNSARKFAQEHRGDFVIHFYRRKGWTPFGFQKSVNTSYVLSRHHAFEVFQLLNRKAKFVAFHMHSSEIWLVDFEINWYVHSHV